MRTRRAAILTTGRPLSWAESLDHLNYVREHGVLQFIKVWQSSRELQRADELLWGDEIEYSILRVTDGKAWVSLRAPQVLDELNAKETEHVHRSEGATWHPEYGSYMIEGTPKRPYSGFAGDLCRVERNMRLRRRRLVSMLKDDEICPTMVHFPRFGVDEFCWPPGDDTFDVAHSASVPDRIINPHPRFAALTANIRSRRGDENVEARPPRFFDTRTPSDLKPHIEGLDAMAYGMGCCCLQVTFQARDAQEARYVYDQLAALAPVMLALTAATPIWRGVLADSDARWDVVAASVDDRTPAERGDDQSAPDDRMAGRGARFIPRSRYSSIARYAFECEEDNQVAQFCDVEAPLDEAALETLSEAGVDPALARHVAGLFVRDPLVVFEGRISELDDDTHSDHFDNIQSTNWNTVRLKPPPPNADAPGWRTEFRPMEVQLTDFENAAFAVFSVLVTRVILAFDLNLYLPVSRIDANVRRAMRRDAATKGRFYFRSNMADKDKDDAQRFEACCGPSDTPAIEQMTAAQIVDGQGDFPGLAPLVYAYLEYIGCDRESLVRLCAYIEHVRKRARGDLPTPARWIRDFVRAHSDYNHDGLVGDKIARDLAVAAHEIGVGKRPAPELLGDVQVRPIDPAAAWDVQLSGLAIPSKQERADLIERYARRSTT